MLKPPSSQTLVQRCKQALLLAVSLVLRNVGYLGMDALEYVFNRHNPHRDPRRLPRFFRLILAFGYWLLGGITTGRWQWPKYPLEANSTSNAG